MSSLSRRVFLGSSALAAGAVGLEAEAADAKAKDSHRPEMEELPTFRFAMEDQPGKVHKGGSAKQATVKELPISTGLAGVSMRLEPGGVRELHWHANAAEWAFVVKGHVRTTVINPDGSSETNDFNPGDVWYFPRGYGHLLQGLGPEESHFVLIFDNGNFSEYGTFSVTDWVAHTPPSVLSKTLGLPAQTFAKFPKEELYIYQGHIPPKEIPPVHQSSQVVSPLTHRWRLMEQEPREHYSGGVERRVTSREFPVQTSMTGAVIDLDQGALREPHWHPNADEWQYIIRGKSRMTIFGSNGRARTEECVPGDAVYVPRGFGHYFENIGNEPLRVLIGFNSGIFEEISLSTWLANNPVAIVADNFETTEEIVKKMPDHRVFIASKDGPGTG